MIQITDANRPKCFKCDELAITSINNHWICGKCFVKYHQKLQEANEKILLEE